MQKGLVLLIVVILLSACTGNQVASSNATPSALMAAIVPDTPTPTRTARPTRTPTLDQVIYPFTVEGLRRHDYQSGDIHIRTTLVETEAYTVYSIDYPSDGLTITGMLYIPAGEGPFPVIVMNHGYFNRNDFTPGDGTDRASDFLAKRGYLTISSDYRSWGESDVGPSFFYSGLAIDVVNLMNAIPSIPQADATRIGMWGHSMGGGVTMKVLAIDRRVQAAVLYSTVSADNADLIDRWGMGCFGDIAAGEQLFGCNSSDIIPESLPQALQDAYTATAVDAEKLKATSPFYYLGDISIPVQIHYGTDDGKLFSGTPPEWSKKLYKGFVEAGNENVELFAYEGEDHSFFADQWFAFMERTAQFFDLHLK